MPVGVDATLVDIDLDQIDAVVAGEREQPADDGVERLGGTDGLIMIGDGAGLAVTGGKN
jgi:hypothetical protein